MCSSKDPSELLQSACKEAKKLDLDISTVKAELSLASNSSQFGQLLLDQHVGLWELRKMKDDQIGKLRVIIAAPSQQQASPSWSLWHLSALPPC